MSACAKCRRPLREGAKFCGQCGHAQDAETSKFQRGAALRTTAALSARDVIISGTEPVSPDVTAAISRTLFVVPASFEKALAAICNDIGVAPLAVAADRDPSASQAKARRNMRSLAPDRLPDFVCIVGGWDDVPPFRVPNPLDGDDDAHCPTDALYGLIEDFNGDKDYPLAAIPDVPVGRIPSLDVEVVRSALLESPPAGHAANQFLFGVTAQCWSEVTQKIATEFTGATSACPLSAQPAGFTQLPARNVLLFPAWDEKDMRAALEEASIPANSILLFNVHGGADDPTWWGQPVGTDKCDPLAFRPGTVADYNGAVLMTEACYGGALGYDEPSIVEHFFSNRGKAFVGSSVVAYGAVNRGVAIDEIELIAADAIALNFLLGLREGLCFGEALTRAKYEACLTDPRLGEYTQKTVLSFNLYGAPWHRIAATPGVPLRSEPPSEDRSASILDRVRTRINSRITEASQRLRPLRDQYRARLPDTGRRFLVERDEALARLRSFQDRSQVDEILDEYGITFEICTMEAIEIDGTTSHLIKGRSPANRRNKHQVALLINPDGRLAKILTSKGMP